MLWLTLLWSALITTSFTAGLFLATAINNRRWSEKCARCQTIVNHASSTPGSVLHVTRGRPR